MSIDYLVLDIKYDIKKDSFEVSGDVNKEGQEEIVDTFLRGQMGKGEDKSKANERYVYHIQMKWYPQNDDIEVQYDTGNKGLRDGILMHYLSSLNKK